MLQYANTFIITDMYLNRLIKITKLLNIYIQIQVSYTYFLHIVSRASSVNLDIEQQKISFF